MSTAFIWLAFFIIKKLLLFQWKNRLFEAAQGVFRFDARSCCLLYLGAARGNIKDYLYTNRTSSS